jgi:predicted transcriptional regulator
MGHDWMFEVLADMKSYAERHGFEALAAKIDETVAVARSEVAGADGGPQGGQGPAAAEPRSKQG